MRIFPLLAAGAGLGAGVAVTRNAHAKPLSPWWDARVGTSGLRRSDLPVGGAFAALVAARQLMKGRRRLAAVALGLAVGSAAGAVGTGLMDPLPPV